MNFVDIYQKYWKNGYTLTDLSLSGIDREVFRSLFNPVAEVFRKYPAGGVHLYIPGVGQVNGFQPGNYFDSAGTTLASVDGSVGLVLDAAGSVEAELATVTSASFTASSSPACVSTNTITVAGKYIIKFDYNVSGTVFAQIGSVNLPTKTGAGSFYQVADITGIGGIQIGLVSATGIISNFSVKRVTGTHATQSTPGYKPTLRRVGGVNYLEFDGVDDRLALGGPLFQMADDHCVVAGVKMSVAPTGIYDVFTQRGATGTPIVCELHINAGRLPVATWRDDAGTLLQLTGSSVLVVGQPYVLAARKVGNSQTLWVNGAIVASSNTVFGATTITTAGIGGDSQAAGGNYFKGAIYDVNPVQGTLTDADVVTESKLAASLAGIQL